MLPHMLLVVLPIPAVVLLTLLTLYHLTPLIHLLPTKTIQLLPLLHNLSNIIPHPRSNLPREFFNLPPRPRTPASSYSPHVSSALGVRGKLVLLLAGQAGLSLACGWGYLLHGEGRGGAAMLAISIAPLPATVLLLAVYSINANQTIRSYESSTAIRQLGFGTGGITHSTIFPRNLPLSLIPTAVIAIICALVPKHARIVLLVSTSALVLILIALSAVGGYRTYFVPKRGVIRLREARTNEKAKEGEEEERGVQAMMDSDSWVTSPSRRSTTNLSAFSYSPSTHTPKHRRTHGSPSSWLSSPTDSPASILPWDYSPDIPSPKPAMTRTRSRSLTPTPELPGRAGPTPKVATKDSTTTPFSANQTRYSYAMTSTPGSALRSPGGSILAGYEPDPFHPMPRSFESLTRYPLSPSQLATGTGTSLATSAIAFVPEQKASMSRKGSSTWTLESWHSAREMKTPDPKGRRAPPPPPMPTGMPLPPSPTASRSEQLFDRPKDSTEMLVAERDWVEVEADGDGLDGWGRGGKGVGLIAVLGVVVCYTFAVPLLANGRSDRDLILYLISLILPAPLLVLTSSHLRFRIPIAHRDKKSSTKSTSTHRSLALMTESQLSLPITISPRLTPPAPKRESTAPSQLSNLLNSKRSTSNFGYNRRHTVDVPVSVYDVEAEETMRRTLARRSGDVWIETGHAIEGGGLLARATEMLKPVPAMRVLSESPRGPGVLTRLRGGVVSMLPGRFSAYDEYDVEHGTEGPIRISVTSPSKFERRQSTAISQGSDGVEVDMTMGGAEIQTATKARISASPTFVYGRSSAEARPREGFEVDWLTAGILPNLVPSIRMGSTSRVGPYPSDTPRREYRSSQFPASPNDGTPSYHSHGQSSSIDFSQSPDFSMATQSTPHSSSLRQRLKHKTSFSLPTIQSADFTDVRRSFEDSRGIDLPPIPVGMSREPRHLTPVTERDESNESHLMRRTLDEMGPALAALDKSQSSATTGSSRMAWSDLAPTVLHGETIGMTSLASFGTEDEEMSEEMERVMAMDTPTRSEFVISRPTTSAGSSLGHRTSGSGKALPPLPTVEHKYGSTTPGSTTTGNSQSGSSIPAVQNFRYSTFAEPVTSHPHPPPLQPSQTTIAPDLIAIAAPHPPLQGLATKNSSETVRSDMTATTTTSTASPTPTPEFRLSRQELLLVQQLRSRRSQSAMAVHQDRGNSSKAVHQDPVCNSLAVGQDKEKEETGQRKGLRPLQLVGDRNTNRMSAPLPMVGEKRYDNKAGPAGPKLSNETRAKMSAASRTGKGSKASHGSGVSGIRI